MLAVVFPQRCHVFPQHFSLRILGISHCGGGESGGLKMRDPGNEDVRYPVLVTRQAPCRWVGGGGGVNVLYNKLLTS